MQEHADPKRGGPEIADELRPGGGRELFGRFVLHDHGAIHDHVQPLPRDMAVVVADRYRNFSRHLMPAIP